MGQHALRFCGIALAATALSACAGDSEKYPSLAIRDVERAQGQFDAVEPEEPMRPVELPIRPITPDSSAEQLVEQASASHSTFVARAPQARTLVAQASGTGRDSDARGRAIVALADLASLRSKTEISLADLDLLIAERANRFEDTALADAAQALVLDLVNEQDRTLSQLWKALGQ